jgi:ABC-type multidrug transport system fused ATPase/permease subunit
VPLGLTGFLILSALVVGAAYVESRHLRRRLAEPAGDVPFVDGGLRGLLRPYRPAVALAIGLDVLAVVAGLAAPWPVKAVVDQVTGGTTSSVFRIAGPNHVVAVAVIAGVSLVGAMCLLDYLSAVLGETIGASVAVGLRRAVLTRLVRLPIRAVRMQRNGDLVTRLTTDVTRVQQATLERWRVLVPNALAMAGMVALMAMLSVPLAAITAILAPLTGLAFWVRRRKVSEAQRTARALSGELAANIGELARSIPAVQAFGREERERARLDATGQAAAWASIRAVVASARLAPFADLIVAMNLGVVLAIGAQQVRTHHLTVGGLVVFLTYLGAMEQPVKALSRLSRTLGAGVASRERLDEILREPELCRASHAAVLGAEAPVVAAHHLDYSYGDGRPALCDVSFCIPAGRITTVVGPNGAGKTTLLQLLMRLDDPDHGVISFNGVDLRDYDLSSLRSSISLVPQDVWLMDGTLYENVAYGNPSASEVDVRRAGRLALVDEIAGRLPKGWATPLGEGGAALSGGERRRVAIARAVLRDCRLLLVDEPTAGLDPEAERFVIDAIETAAAGRTTVIVTHNRALAAIGSEVIRLEQGRVTAEPGPNPAPALRLVGAIIE